MFDIQLPIIITHAALLTVSLFTGILVYLHDNKSATNKVFTALVLSIVLWDVANFLSFSFIDPYHALIGIKFVMMSASLLTICILFFTCVFPKKDLFLTKRKKIFIAVASVLFIVSGYFVWGDIDMDATLQSGVPVPLPYEIVFMEHATFPVMPIWGFFSIVSLLSAIIVLVSRYKRSQGEDKKRYMSVILGLATTFFLLPVFLFLPVALFQKVDFNYYGPLAYVPLFLGAGYGILRHHIFNVKVMLVEILVFAGLLILFINIFI